MAQDYFARRERSAFLQTIKSHLGNWYIWGGDDPLGFDCSGLVVEGLRAAGRLKEIEDLPADGLWHKYHPLHKVEFPKEGALVFWFDKNGRATHIAICIDEFFYIGAEGGGRKVLTVEDAVKYNAFIKIRPLSSRAGARFVYIWKD